MKARGSRLAAWAWLALIGALGLLIWRMAATPAAAGLRAEAPALVVVKRVGAEILRVGDLLTYTVVVTNVGTGTAYGVDILDALPLIGLQYVEGSAYAVWPDAASPYTADPTGQPLHFDISATLEGGEALALAYRVQGVQGVIPSVLYGNTATAVGEDGLGNPIPADNSAAVPGDWDPDDSDTASLVGWEPFVYVGVRPWAGCSAPGTVVTFTTSYYDEVGWEDLVQARFLLGASAQPTQCVNLRYDVAANKMYMLTPAGTRWSGGMTPGEQGIIRNTYAALDVGRSAVIASGKMISVTWVFTPTYRNSGEQHNLYTAATDERGVWYGWSDPGDWTINRAPTSLPPEVNKVALTATLPYLIKPAYRDLDGRDNLRWCYMVIADEEPSGLDGGPGVWLRYDHQEGVLQLWDPAAGDWLSAPPKTDFRMGNEYVLVYGPASRVIDADVRTLAVQWKLAFAPAFAGRHALYMRAVDKLAPCEGDTGWKWKGWYEVVE